MIEYLNLHVDYCFKGCLIGSNQRMGLKINILKNVSIPQDCETKLYVRVIMSIGLKNTLNYEIYGFKDYRERNLFNELIEINGVGPKTAMSLLEFGIDNLIKCVEQGDFDQLKQNTKITSKQMNAIIAYLSFKYEGVTKTVSQAEPTSKLTECESELLKQTSATLLALGYGKSLIEKIMKRLDFQSINDVSDAVNQAIRLMN